MAAAARGIVPVVANLRAGMERVSFRDLSRRLDTVRRLTGCRPGKLYDLSQPGPVHQCTRVLGGLLTDVFAAISTHDHLSSIIQLSSGTVR